MIIYLGKTTTKKTKKNMWIFSKELSLVHNLLQNHFCSLLKLMLLYTLNMLTLQELQKQHHIVSY